MAMSEEESLNECSPSRLMLKLPEESAAGTCLRDEPQACSRPLPAVSCAARGDFSTKTHSSKTHSTNSGCSITNSSRHGSSYTGCNTASWRDTRTEVAFTTPAADVEGAAQEQGRDGDGPEASYYMRLLQYKKRHLQAEITRLETETETATRETQQHSALQQKKEELENAVRSLQKDIAVINLAVSQGRLNLSETDLINKTQRCREANEEKVTEGYGVHTTSEQNPRFSRMYVSRMREEHLHLLEAEHEVFFDSLLNRVDLQPQTRVQYEQLRSRLQQNQETLNKLCAECATTCQQLSTAETRLRGDGPRQKLRLLRRQEMQQQQLECLDVKALPSLRLPLDEQRAGVLHATLELKNQIRRLDLKQQRAQQEVQKHQARIAELQEALTLTNDGVAATSEEQEKLRLLAVRDTEISTFLEQQKKTVGTEIRRRAALCAEELFNAQQQKQDLEKTLQQISTKEQLQKLEEENLHKRHALEENKTHAQHLESQLQKAELELLEVPRLEQVKERAIGDVKRRTEKLNGEITSIYDNLDALNRSKAQEQEQIVAQKKRMLCAIEEATAEINAICQEIQQLQQEFQQYSELGPLVQLLKRLVERKAAVKQLRTRLEAEKKKHDYEAVKGRCLQLTDKINACIRCALADQASTSGGGATCVQTQS